ncbi:hypothetical protein HZA43_04920 [Candidatus Peregrinibacteria bacterium]|nr:hypothetical protein [Candidatus Peregrinibacteria bacterium]
MLIIKEPILFSELQKNHIHFFQNLIKIVVDIKNKRIMADAEMHADLEQALIERGSCQEDLWGANLYLNKTKETFVEFTSLINIRPSQKNRSMEIQDPSLRGQMHDVIHHLIQYDV